MMMFLSILLNCALLLAVKLFRERLHSQEAQLGLLYREMRYWQKCAGSLGRRIEQLLESQSDLHEADWWKEGDEP